MNLIGAEKGAKTEAARAIKLEWPVPGYKRVTSGYRTAERPKHQGIDIGRNLTPAQAIEGATIVAAAEGKVLTVIANHASMGNMVAIDHGGGVITRYMHNKRNLVSVGQEIKKGEPLGMVGSTGNSTGPHLHFEVMINGTAVDPMQYLSKN